MKIEIVKQSKIPIGETRGRPSKWRARFIDLPKDRGLLIQAENLEELQRIQNNILGCFRANRKNGCFSNSTLHTKRQTDNGKFILYAWLSEN